MLYSFIYIYLYLQLRYQHVFKHTPQRNSCSVQNWLLWLACQGRHLILYWRPMCVPSFTVRAISSELGLATACPSSPAPVPCGQCWDAAQAGNNGVAQDGSGVKASLSSPTQIWRPRSTHSSQCPAGRYQVYQPGPVVPEIPAPDGSCCLPTLSSSMLGRM